MKTRRSPGLWPAALGLAVAAGAGHLLAEGAGLPLWALVAKPVPVLLLLAWVAGAERSPLRGPLALGLALSAVGDVLIQRPGGFLAGLGAFLLAHLAYTTGFWRARPQRLASLALPFLLFAGVMGYWIAPGTGGMEVPVGVYILAISAMMWRASVLVGALGYPALVGRLALGGALLFAASDSLIAIHRFVAPQPWANVPIMLLYWLGQAGIAAAAVVAGRAPGSADPGDRLQARGAS
ncbi:MAG: lysoplasmalogenase [Thermoanaerobaculia bacterium]